MTRYTLPLVVLMLGVALSAARPEPPGAEREALEKARERLQALLHEVDLLRETAAHEVREQNLRQGLTRECGEVRETAGRLEKELRPGAEPRRLHATYQELDRQVERLIQDAGRVKPEARGVHQVAGRVRQIGDHLDFQAVAWNPAEDRARGGIVRQARALEWTAKELAETARGLFPPDRPGGRFVEACERLSRAAGAFRGEAERGQRVEELRRHFGPVAQAWTQLARQYAGLPPREGYPLDPSIEHLDDAAGRLAGLLKVGLEPAHIRPDRPPAVGRELARFQGTWLVDSEQAMGSYVRIEGNRATVGTNNGLAYVMMFWLLTPDAEGIKEIDLWRIEGVHKGSFYRGIYRFDGPNRLYICYNFTPGGRRPTQFVTNEAANIYSKLWVRRR
jgi:uncharacterized protein (TIGR03067 family)